MASVNKVILLGNLGRDPETRYTTGGDAVTNLNIATSEQWKDKSGEKQERTEWHRVVLFGRQAEVAGEYLKKGRSVYIEGRLQTRKYTDKDGVEKYSTEIVADRMQLIGGARDGGGGGDVEFSGGGGGGGGGGGARRESGGGGKPAAAAARPAAARRTSTTSTTTFRSRTEPSVSSRDQPMLLTVLKELAASMRRRPGTKPAGSGPTGAAMSELEASCRRRVETMPHFSDAHNELGVVLEKEGRLAEAETAFRTRRRAEQQQRAGSVQPRDHLRADQSAEGGRGAVPERAQVAPRLVDAHYNLGVLLMNTQRFS